MGREKAGSCKPRIGIPPLPHPSPAGNKANGRPKRKGKKKKKIQSQSGAGVQRPLGFVSWRGGFVGLGARAGGAGGTQGALRHGAAREKRPSMKPCRPINAAGRPVLSSDPSRGPPESHHPRATQTGAGGDRVKPAQSGVLKSSKDGKQAQTPAREGRRPPPSLRDPTRAGPQSRNCPGRLSSARGDPGCGKPERREPPLQL